MAGRAARRPKRGASCALLSGGCVSFLMGVVRSAWDAVAPEVQQRRARALAPRRSSSAAAFQTPTPRGFRASYRAGYGLGTTIAGLHATRERAWRRTARAVPPESASLLEKAAHLPTPRTPPARCAHPFAAARGCAPASRRPRHWRPPGTCWRRAAPRVGAAIGAPRTRRAARVRARAARGRPPRPPSPGTRCCAAQHGRGGWGGAAAGARRGGPSAQGRESRARAWTSYYSYFEVQVLRTTHASQTLFPLLRARGLIMFFRSQFFGFPHCFLGRRRRKNDR